MIFAERLGGRDFGKETKLYKFAAIKQAKAEARASHPDLPLIDLGVGEPDLPADPAIVEILAREAGKPENRFYADNGIPEFQEAAVQYLERVYLVSAIDPYRLYINYPNNPTGQTATEEFYREVVDFAGNNDLIVVSDAAYAALTYDGYEPLSFLSSPGATEVGVEIHSLSKAFNMTGWRLAFLAGNPEIVKAYGAIKDNTDSGQFRAIQKAGIYALDHVELTKVNCERYSRRFDLLIPVLREVGFEALKPKASFYCYIRAPKGTKSGRSFKNAEDTASYLLKEALILTVPWDDAGPYLRLAVTFEAKSFEEEEKVITEIKRRLLRLDLNFSFF